MVAGVRALTKQDVDAKLKTALRAWTTDEPPLHRNKCLLDKRPQPDTLQNLFVVPWQQAPQMVAHRFCILRQGNIIMDGRMVPALMQYVWPGWLQREFESFLANVGRVLKPPVESEERAKRKRYQPPLLEQQATAWTVLVGRFVSEAASSLQKATSGGRAVDEAGVLPFEHKRATMKHVPLCMGQMQAWMTRNGVLKHVGRLQYGLFLRDVGFSVAGAAQHVQACSGLASGVAPERVFTQSARVELGRLLGASGGKKYSAHCCRTIQSTGSVCSAAGAHGCPWMAHKTEGGQAHLYGLLRGSGHDHAAARALVDRWASGSEWPNMLCQADCASRGGAVLASTTKVGVFPAWFSIELHTATMTQEQEV